MWSVYILECNDSSFYTGISDDLDKRLQRHNAGRGAVYTKLRRPVKLLYAEDYETKSLARIREIEIKNFSVLNKRKLIRYGIGKRFVRK